MTDEPYLEPEHLTPRMVPIDRMAREAGIYYGLMGPTDESELSR